MKFRKFIMIFFFILFVGLLNVREGYSAVVSSRISGKDPLLESIAVSNLGWYSSQNVILVLKEDYEDTLTAPLLSQSLKAPILYTDRDNLNEDALKEIIRLDAKNVYVVGKNIPDSIVSKIKGMGINCNAVSGSDKYEISAAIASLSPYEKSTRVIISSGNSPIDTLSACIVGAKKEMPVLLVEKDNIPAQVKGFIDSRKIKEAYVMGGEDVISNSVSSQFESCERIYGEDAYQRNTVFLKMFEKDFDFAKLYIASGSDLLYSMPGVGLAVNENAPLIFVESNFAKSSRGFVETKLSNINEVVILGDDKLISDSVLGQFEETNSRDGQISDRTYEDFEKYIRDNYYIESNDKTKMKIDKVSVGQKNNDGNSIYIYLDMNRSNYDSLFRLSDSKENSRKCVEAWMKSITEAAKAYYADKTVNCELWCVDTFDSYPEDIAGEDIEFNPETRKWDAMQKEASFMIAEDGQFTVEWAD